MQRMPSLMTRTLQRRSVHAERERQRIRQQPPDFRKLLGEQAWNRLPEAVRARFDATAHSAVTTYCGYLNVSANWAGRLLAWICKLIGTPIAPLRGEGVPVRVRVFNSKQAGGTVWEREYAFPGHNPITVRSTKQIDYAHSLIEVLNAGLHMRLRVFEDAGALHFLSHGYYFRVGSMRVALPHWFPPGITHVVHQDQGRGHFRFTMWTSHPWFGEMFRQDGVFSD